jgi:hypothetical protein
LTNVELAARYAGVAPTTLRRALAGEPSNGTLARLDKALNELEELKQYCWPIPIDWSEFVFVRMTQERIRNHSLKIEIVKVPVSMEAGLEALGTAHK